MDRGADADIAATSAVKDGLHGNLQGARHALRGISDRSSELRGVRIVIVLGPLELGGAERQALALAEALMNDYGADVHVVGTIGKPGRAAEMCDAIGVPWSMIPAGIVTPPVGARAGVRSVKRLVRFGLSLRALRPDVLLPYMTMPNVNCGLVWRATGARVCIWSQRVTGDDGRFVLRRLAARLSSAAVANSSAGKEYLVQELAVPEPRVHIIANGIVADAPTATRPEWRKALGIAPESIVATMVANLHERKDHATLLEAWAQVVDGESDAARPVLVLAGRFDTTHDTLQRRSRELGIDAYVRFAGEVTDVSGLYAASDICVLSSHHEGTPNAVLEGMFAGVPVVATDLPGVREAVGIDGAPFLFPPGDAFAIASHLRRLIADSALRAAVGNQMRARALRVFSVSTMVRSTAELIAQELASALFTRFRTWGNSGR